MRSLIRWALAELNAWRLTLALLVAKRELDELHRWRVHAIEADRWLAEFPDAVDAISYVRTWARGGGVEIWDVREAMRARRADQRIADFDAGRLMGSRAVNACGLTCRRGLPAAEG